MPELEVPGPPQDWQQSEDWKSDTFAVVEASGYDVGKIKTRNEAWAHAAVGYCIPALIVGAFILFGVTMIIYVIHLIAPASWRWLTADELTHVHSIIFSGVVGAALAEGYRRYLK